MDGSRARGNGRTATLAELVRCRPVRRDGGFAPGGRVTTHQLGAHRSVFGGRGMEFDEARVYRAGDDVRTIDWRVTARTGTVHTKLFREERERPVTVLVDLRASMHFGTRVRFKSVLAARVAALLSWTALDGGDRLGGVLIGERAVRAFPPTRGRSGVLQWLDALGGATHPPEASESPGSAPSLDEALRRLRRAARPGSLVFVVGDFADLDDAVEAELARLSRHAHVTCILIHDPLEAHLPATGGLAVGDGTSVLSLDRLGRDARAAHASRFDARRARLEALSRRHAMAFRSLSTTDEAESVLHPHQDVPWAKAPGRRAA